VWVRVSEELGWDSVAVVGVHAGIVSQKKLIWQYHRGHYCAINEQPVYLHATLNAVIE
jgi:hypothetical protein